MAPDAPVAFGRYTLLERLALGGMAEVFRAKITSSHGFEKVLVIKRILPHLAADQSFVSMFIDEAKLTAQLTHPKIIQILDFGAVAGQYFTALEYIDGFDALALLRVAAQKRVHVPRQIGVFIASEVLEALDYAHNARDMEGKRMHIVHRDISPSNIFISRRGDVKLGDFGIAHAQRRESKTQVGTLKGKYGYMSPEQVVGRPIDARSDLFAVGIVLAELLTGRRLFTADNDLDVLLKVRDVKLDRLDKYGARIPPALDRIVRRALKKDAGERYQTAAELRDALADYLFAAGERVGASDLRAFTTTLFEGVTDPSGRQAPPRKREGSAAQPAAGGTTRAVARRVRVVSGGEEAGGAGEPAAPGSGAPTPPMGTPTIVSDVMSDAPTASVAVAQEDVTGSWPGEDSGERSARGFTPVSRPETGSEGERQLIAATADARTHSDVGRFVSGVPPRPPDSAGDVSVISAIRLLCDLALAGETGLLRLELGSAQKEIFLVRGAPESVNSNDPGERFGEYLVAHEVITPPDLELALSMLPHYNGKLGDTLVALGMLRPLDVFRLLSDQVRDRVIDVFSWSEGTFAFYRGVTNRQDNFPLGLDTFQILGAGVVSLSPALLDKKFGQLLDFHPAASEQGRVDPDAFGIGPTPREVLALLDGSRTLREWMAAFGDEEERLTFLRSLYLLLETDLAELD